jgi:uncharacterized membrane protein
MGPPLILGVALVAVLTSGTVAGVLFSVARAVAPTFDALPGDRWVQVHQLLDPHFDPFMPRVTKVTLAAAAVVTALGRPWPAQLLFGAGLAASVGVALVSEVANVPMNRRVLAWRADDLPAEWPAVRERWKRANRLRTACAWAAFALYAAGTAVIR